MYVLVMDQSFVAGDFSDHASVTNDRLVKVYARPPAPKVGTALRIHVS